jgi:hypothetical protein
MELQDLPISGNALKKIAQCHRTWDEIVKLRQFGEANVRFSAVPAGEQQVLRGRRSAHPMHGLPQPPRQPGGRIARVRSQLPLACHSENAPPVAGEGVPRAKVCRWRRRSASPATCQG